MTRVLLCLLLIQGNLFAQIQRTPAWRPATYQGMIIGKARTSDMKRLLGKPKRVERFPGVTWYVYDGASPFRGEVTVVVEKSIVVGVDVGPDELSKEEAVKHFGPDHVLTRYDFEPCLGDEDSGPVFESANGEILSVEYRHRGIAISVTQDGRVNTISYVSKPIGTRESRCKSLKKR